MTAAAAAAAVALQAEVCHVENRRVCLRHNSCWRRTSTSASVRTASAKCRGEDLPPRRARGEELVDITREAVGGAEGERRPLSDHRGHFRTMFSPARQAPSFRLINRRLGSCLYVRAVQSD